MAKKRNMIEYMIPVGILFIFLGVIIIFAGSMLMAGQQEKAGSGSKTGVHVGVGGFIGPIPFGFANSRTALYVVIGLAVFTMVVWLILRYAV